MRKMDVSVSRSIPREDVLPEYIKKIPADYKGKDFPMTLGPVLRDFPEDLDEIVKLHGKSATFNDFCMPTLRLNAQNALAEEGKAIILTPEAKNGKRSGGVAVKVEL